MSAEKVLEKLSKHLEHQFLFRPRSRELSIEFTPVQGVIGVQRDR